MSFEFATAVFKDSFGIERIDDREDYGEERFLLIGMAEGNVLFVVYTEREERIRIPERAANGISARRATQREQDGYFEENA